MCTLCSKKVSFIKNSVCAMLMHLKTHDVLNSTDLDQALVGQDTTSGRQRRAQMWRNSSEYWNDRAAAFLELRWEEENNMN